MLVYTSHMHSMPLSEREAHDARLPCAQVVSERLSRHVLKNWKRFVEGINEVATIEIDLEVTFQTASNVTLRCFGTSAAASSSARTAPGWLSA